MSLFTAPQGAMVPAPVPTEPAGGSPETPDVSFAAILAGRHATLDGEVPDTPEPAEPDGEGHPAPTTIAPIAFVPAAPVAVTWTPPADKVVATPPPPMALERTATIGDSPGVVARRVELDGVVPAATGLAAPELPQTRPMTSAAREIAPATRETPALGGDAEPPPPVATAPAVRLMGAAVWMEASISMAPQQSQPQSEIEDVTMPVAGTSSSDAASGSRHQVWPPPGERPVEPEARAGTAHPLETQALGDRQPLQGQAVPEPPRGQARAPIPAGEGEERREPRGAEAAVLTQASPAEPAPATSEPSPATPRPTRAEGRGEAHARSRVQAEQALSAVVGLTQSTASPVAAEVVPQAVPPQSPGQTARAQDVPHPLLRPPVGFAIEETGPVFPVDARAAVEAFTRIERAGLGEHRGGEFNGDGERGNANRGFRSMPVMSADTPVAFEALASPGAPEAVTAAPTPGPATTPKAAGHETLPGVGPQIVKAVHLQWKDGTGEARLRLNPEQLGEVVVHLHVGAGGVRATMSAESPEVRAWMAAHEDDLRAGLEEQGLSLTSLKVNDEPPDERRHQEQPRERQPRRRTPDPDMPTFELSA